MSTLSTTKPDTVDLDHFYNKHRNSFEPNSTLFLYQDNTEQQQLLTDDTYQQPSQQSQIANNQNSTADQVKPTLDWLAKFP
ncbi:8626_t:CDS:2, partial [Racocetra persica]